LFPRGDNRVVQIIAGKHKPTNGPILPVFRSSAEAVWVFLEQNYTHTSGSCGVSSCQHTLTSGTTHIKHTPASPCHTHTCTHR